MTKINVATVFEGRMWDVIVSVPDHCLSFYFPMLGMQEQLSLSASKAHNLVCTVIWTQILRMNNLLTC